MLKLKIQIVFIAILLPSLVFVSYAESKERRIALVVGNWKYRTAPLVNPKNDAKTIAQTLAKLGFNVSHVQNANRKVFRRAIRNFGDKLKKGGVGLFFYAGHGMQIEGKNYLIPVGTDIASEDEVIDEAVEVDLLLRKLATARNSLNIVILDACRNNPFERSFRSINRGLAVVNAPQGTFIAYATKPGSVAADGKGKNSPFTKSLAREMLMPGISIEETFRKVRKAVFKETGSKQTPWDSSSLMETFIFNPTSKTAIKKLPSTPSPNVTRVNYNNKTTKNTHGYQEKARYEDYINRLEKSLKIFDRKNALFYFNKAKAIYPESANEKWNYLNGPKNAKNRIFLKISPENKSIFIKINGKIVRKKEVEIPYRKSLDIEIGSTETTWDNVHKSQHPKWKTIERKTSIEPWREYTLQASLAKWIPGSFRKVKVSPVQKKIVTKEGSNYGFWETEPEWKWVIDENRTIKKLINDYNVSQSKAKKYVSKYTRYGKDIPLEVIANRSSWSSATFNLINLSK
ncbi:MAG: caspase family protein [Magnetococcales bacterium]|nr:caspase family protein [Magnetococcales bacterium]